jgi:hypothetical protein
MNFEDQVYFGCAAYSSIHPHRAAELNHLFLVIGNGYEWEDGRLVAVCDHQTYKNGKPMSLSAAINRVFRDRRKRDEWKKRDDRNRKRREKRNPVVDKPLDEKLDKLIDDAIAAMKKEREADPEGFEKKRLAHLEEFKASKRRWREEKKWDYRIPVDIDQRRAYQEPRQGAHGGYNNWYPVCQYSKIVTFPENVKNDWLLGIIEVCRLVIANPPVVTQYANENTIAETLKLTQEALDKAVALAQKRGIKGYGEQHLTLKVGQRVQIVKSVPWSGADAAVASQPRVGLKGKIADPKKYPYPTPPEGKTAVILKSTDLGYEPWDKDHATQVRYIPTECLKAI